MLTIIHGEDTQASRNYFYQEKTKYTDLITFDGNSVKIEDIVQALSGDGLFTQEKHIVFEELISKRKAGKETSDIHSYIASHHEDAIIYLFESKELTTKQLGLLKSATVKIFKLPLSIFLFLDSFKPRNSKSLITLFHKTLEYKDEQFIFFMMVRHFRMLLALSNERDSSAIDEIKRMAPWQKTKLQKQALLFSPELLTRIYNRLFQIDTAQKSGRLAYPLSQTIDFLLLEL